MDKYLKSQELNRVEKRAIEALAIAPVIRMVSRKIGKDEALKILKEVNEQEAFERGKSLKKKEGKNGIAELAREVNSWGEGGNWEMDVLQQTPVTYFFNVRQCPYYEKYRELGLLDLGVELSCCRDKPFAQGFNSKLKLVRSKTIMEGAEYCDFRYYLNSK